MKRRTRQATPKLIALFLIPIVALSLMGLAQSHWSKSIYIEGTVNTGYWKAGIKIQKTLYGSYTDSNGDDLIEPIEPNLIVFSAGFPTKFKLIIKVENCGSTTLTNVVVTDTIKKKVDPINCTASKGTFSWDNHKQGNNNNNQGNDEGDFIFNDLTWDIGTLAQGESAFLVIWIETLQNPPGIYAPSGYELEGIEVNEGATVDAESTFSHLSATTGSISIHFDQDGIITNLPYYTGWAKDSYLGG